MAEFEMPAGCCPYCGAEIVVRNYADLMRRMGIEDEWEDRYYLDHADPKEAADRDCPTLYHSFATPEEAAEKASRRASVDGSTSDGFHTFDELYYHRTALFACLVSVQPRQMAFKAWKHADGSMYDGFFIAGIYTSRGWCTYHCEEKWWPLFDCSELAKAPKWDGHTPSNAIHRLMADFLPEQEVSGEVAE